METRTSIAILLLASSTALAAPTIRSLGALNGPPPNGGWTNSVSSDGLTISGYGNTTIPPSGVPVTLGAVARLTPLLDGNYVSLPPLSSINTFNTSGFAYASSNVAAGRATVGTSSNVSGISHATLWNSNNALVDLAPLDQSTYSAAFDITPDSHYVVGSIGINPVRWTLSPSITITTLSRGIYNSATPFGISADGGIAVGRASFQSDPNTHAVRWRGSEPPQSLGLLPGAVSASAVSVSDNGGTVVGWNQNIANSTFFRAFSWHPLRGLTELSAATPGVSCQATCVSANGSLIGGFDQPADINARRAILWNHPNSPRLLADLLASLGTDLTGWNLTHVRGISADGTILSGLGIYNSAAVSFLVTLPPLCPSDYNLDYTVDFFDYLDFVADFADNRIDADFNRDGAIDLFDYLDFVAAFTDPC